MTRWVVDTKDLVAQAVMPSYACEPDGRFFTVDIDTPAAAIEFALAAKQAGCTTIAEFKATSYAAGFAAGAAEHGQSMMRIYCIAYDGPTVGGVDWFRAEAYRERAIEAGADGRLFEMEVPEHAPQSVITELAYHEACETAPPLSDEDEAPEDARAPVTEISLERIEGVLASATATTFGAASAVLSEWAESAPARGGYDKTKVEITWANGMRWEYRCDLQHPSCGAAPDVAADLRHSIDFVAGRARPATLSQEAYERIMRRYQNQGVAAVLECIEQTCVLDDGAAPAATIPVASDTPCAGPAP